MSNFQQIEGGLSAADSANQMAEEGLDRLQQQKEEKLQEGQEFKDSIAGAGELLGGSLTEKGLENIIKRGVKLGTSAMKKLGINTAEFEKMAADYKEGGSSKMLDGLLNRGTMKTKEAANKFIQKFNQKLDQKLPTKPNISLDENGLPRVVSDLPPDAPIANASPLTKGGDEFRPSTRALDPDFELGKYKVKTEDGQQKIVNRETNEDIAPDEFSKPSFDLPKRPFEEAPDPLETLSRDPQGLQAFHDRMNNMGLNNDTEVKPLDSNTFEYNRPVQPKPSLPETPDTGRIGDVDNLPEEFKPSGYDNSLSNMRDYGKQISNAFNDAKADTSKILDLNARKDALRLRKANLDNDSYKEIYKNAIRKQPARKLRNGVPDLDREGERLNFRENAMDNVEKLQAQAPKPTQPPAEPKPEPGTEDFTPSTQAETEPINPDEAAGKEFDNLDFDSLFPEPPTNNLTNLKTPDTNFGSDNPSVFDNVSKSLNDANNTIQQKSVSKTLGELPKITPDGDDAVVKSGEDVFKGAVEKAAGETSEIVGAGGGVEDIAGDIIGAVVGVGTLISSIVGAKPKPPPPRPTIDPVTSTVQIGANI